MDRNNIVKEWFRHAKMDLESADVLARTIHPAPFEVICFLCQQSVEKDLKGFIVSHDVEPPKIHNLLELCKLSENFDKSFSQLYDKCDKLNRYGVIPRYPNELQITEDDMNICLRYTREIKEFIRKLVDNDVIIS